MTRHRSPNLLFATALASLVAWSWQPAGWATPNLNPFAVPSKARLSPFHIGDRAQAEEGPAEPAAEQRTPELSKRTDTGTSKQTAVCSRDDQCPAGTICDNGTCQRFERAVDILLYRKEGPSTAFIPFYWSKRGNPGHRVVIPFYYHF